MIKLLRDRAVTMPVMSIALPSDSLAAAAFDVTDYADAFRIQLPAGQAPDPDALVSLLATSAPRWVDALMALRNRIVSTIGLRTPRPRRASVASVPHRYEPGEEAGIFRVYARSEDEIMMGGDDRHLDFRASMLVQREGAVSYAVLVTVVHYNNWLGRAYFLPVRPFHRLIIPAILRRMRARLTEAEAEQTAPTA